MKYIAPLLVTALVVTASLTSFAQGPARGRVDPPRDPIMETTAQHNLDVARWYLTKRKAFDGARDRLQEILDTYPEFSRLDEVLFLMGEVNFKLDKSEKAGEFYQKVIKDFPGSEFAKKARERLKELNLEVK
ncbi:MAG TPA: outer membrane protein assembly factor BamD [Blastocatellia bacterium]|nr:outer membrane protein assembly factor BamD [Blastocatellia bacterium]